MARWLFGLTFTLVVSVGLMLHSCSAGGDTGDVSGTMTSMLVSPYVQMANDAAQAEGRPTTLDDVMANVPDPNDPAVADLGLDTGSGAGSIAAPTFTEEDDRVVVTFGELMRCDITIVEDVAVSDCTTTAS